MAAYDAEKLITHLQSKWGQRKCPMCDQGGWNIQPAVFQLAEFSDGALKVGGPVVPVIPVVCINCGHTVLVNALVCGAINSEPSQKGVKA